MKTNPNDLLNDKKILSMETGKAVNAGLTKREYFAAMALQGILAGRHEGLNSYKALWAANAALECANALVEELNK